MGELIEQVLEVIAKEAFEAGFVEGGREFEWGNGSTYIPKLFKGDGKSPCQRAWESERLDVLADCRTAALMTPAEQVCPDGGAADG